MPGMTQQLAEPDELDYDRGTKVFLCRDKATGRATGTMRIQTSHLGALRMEHSVELPDWLRDAPRAEITRLAVHVGADPLTKLCLMKASYLYCVAQQVSWMAIGARNDALIRNYRRLGFYDVLGPGEQVSLAHTGGLLHRIMCFNVTTAKTAWNKARHPLYGFMVETVHEDLHVGPIVPTLPPAHSLGWPSQRVAPA